MIETILRWLLPRLYLSIDAHSTQLLLVEDHLRLEASRNHEKLCKYLGALAAQNRLTLEEVKAQRRNLDALAGCEVASAEKIEKVRLLAADILKGLPVGGSQISSFPEGVQKKDKAWPRK